jgi:hypothetical protein
MLCAGLRLVAFVALTVVASAGVAMAAAEPEAAAPSKNQVSWSYLDAGYVYANLEEADVPDADDAQGIGLALSMEVFEYFHITGNYSWTSDDDVDFSSVFGGVGGHFTVLDSTDLFMDIGYAYGEVDVDGAEGHDDGVGLRGGVRSLVIDNLEVELSGSYADLDESVTAGLLGTRYYLDNVYGIGIDFEYTDEGTYAAFAALRFDFGRGD